MDKISQQLVDKIKEDDLLKSEDNTMKSINKNKLMFSIITKSNCENCELRDIRSKFVLPCGNINSKIIIIGEIPSSYDGENHTSFSDAPGRLLTLILDKIGISRDDFYLTTISKCPISDEDKYKKTDVCYSCASLFLLNEIKLIKPKKIIAMGLDAINYCRTVFCNLPESTDVLEVRGDIVNGFLDEQSFLVMQTISCDFLLSKNGALYDLNKKYLWQDMVRFTN